MGLPAVTVLGVVSRDDEPLRVHVERVDAVAGCPVCGVIAHVKDRRRVELVDLPSFGRPTRLVWHKRRFRCPEPPCPHGSCTEQDPLIAPPRPCLSDRAGRWICEQVGRCGRSVAEVAKELGCDWHTVNDALLAYGDALIDDEGRFGVVEALTSTRCSSCAKASSAASATRPRSSTSAADNSSTSCPVAAGPRRRPG